MYHKQSILERNNPQRIQDIDFVLNAEKNNMARFRWVIELAIDENEDDKVLRVDQNQEDKGNTISKPIFNLAITINSNNLFSSISLHLFVAKFRFRKMT